MCENFKNCELLKFPFYFSFFVSLCVIQTYCIFIDFLPSFLIFLGLLFLVCVADEFRKANGIKFKNLMMNYIIRLGSSLFFVLPLVLLLELFKVKFNYNFITSAILVASALHQLVLWCPSLDEEY